MTADLHLHTEASFDSYLSFDDRIDSAKENDIDVIALTDHNAVHPRLRNREEEFNNVNVITGIEITAFGKHGRLDILGYFVDPKTIRGKIQGEHRPKYRHAIHWIHDAGGAAVLAHPGRYDDEMEEIVEALVEMRIDGIECDYPYEKIGISNDFIEKAEQLAGEYDLVKTGGSDCHGGRRKSMGAVKIDVERVENLREVSERYR
ncbi:MAG: PHP domain-containing protein [Candidatus Nanohaloarchaea archaeon]